MKLTRRTLINVTLAFLLAIALVIFNAHKGSADQRDFTVYNETSYTIERLYVSPHSSDNWEEDVLGSTYSERAIMLRSPFQKSRLLLLRYQSGLFRRHQVHKIQRRSLAASGHSTSTSNLTGRHLCAPEEHVLFGRVAQG